MNKKKLLPITQIVTQRTSITRRLLWTPHSLTSKRKIWNNHYKNISFAWLHFHFLFLIQVFFFRLFVCSVNLRTQMFAAKCLSIFRFISFVHRAASNACQSLLLDFSELYASKSALLLHFDGMAFPSAVRCWSNNRSPFDGSELDALNSLNR